MNLSSNGRQWPAEGNTRVPYWVYSDGAFTPRLDAHVIGIEAPRLGTSFEQFYFVGKCDRLVDPDRLHLREYLPWDAHRRLGIGHGEDLPMTNARPNDSEHEDSFYNNWRVEDVWLHASRRRAACASDPLEP